LADTIAEIRLVIKQDKYNFDYDKWEKLNRRIKTLKLNLCDPPIALNSNFIVDLADEIRELKEGK
jgi:hypothetical protein